MKTITIRLLISALAITFMLSFYTSAHADPDHHGCQGNCPSDGGGDVAVSLESGDVNASPSYNSKSLGIGLSNGLGDVDINDCLASTQFGTPLFSKQGVILNKWCAAEVYDAKGLYKMAAVMRCDIQDVRKHFASKEECQEANTVVITQVITYVPEPQTQSTVDVYHDDHEEEEEEVHDGLAERLAELETKREADARRATRYANEQRAYESEQRSYAQQALADLEEYKN